MQYRIFAIPALNPDPATAGLNQFLKSHPVHSVDRQFVENGEHSFWSFCISVSELSTVNLPDGRPHRGRKKVDYHAELGAEKFAVFDALRHKRKMLAEKEGVPVYAVFTNEQLAEMARLKVPSREALRQIEGIGAKRVEQYAEAFLAVLQSG